MPSPTDLAPAPIAVLDPRAVPRAGAAGRHLAGPTRPERRGHLDRVLDLGLVAVALAGLLAATWFAASAVFGLALVSFATGSMSPDFPTGSVAVSAPVALTSTHVGDVVTVSRGAHELPITHRVIRIEVAANGRSARVWLRGDANRYADPAPYDVTSLRRIVAPVPFGADVIRVAGSPVGLGVTAMLVAGGLLWAVWPRSRRAA